MTNPNPVASMILELMAKGNARGLPMERSPELGQYLRSAHGFDLPSERIPGGREAPNVREFPASASGVEGMRFDSEGWPTQVGGANQRMGANIAADRGNVQAGRDQILQSLGLRPGLPKETYAQVLGGLSDEEILSLATQVGYSGVQSPGFLRQIMATDFSLMGKF